MCRLFAGNQTKKANVLLDTLLANAKTYIVNYNLTTIPVSEFETAFKKPPPSEELGTFSASNGFISDLSTLTRRKDFSLYEDENRLTIYGIINMNDFKVLR